MAAQQPSHRHALAQVLKRLRLASLRSPFLHVSLPQETSQDSCKRDSC